MPFVPAFPELFSIVKNLKELVNIDSRSAKEPEPRVESYGVTQGSIPTPEEPIHLSTENGTEKIRAIRINYFQSEPKAPHLPPPGLTSMVSRESLRDWQNVLSTMPGVELWIVARKEDIGEKAKKGPLWHLIDNMPRSIRSRVKMIPYDNDSLALWAQDGSKPILGGRATAIFEKVGTGQKGTNRKDYKSSTKTLSNTAPVLGKNKKGKKVARPVLEKVVELPFDSMGGGNYIVGQKHIFIGTTDIDNIAGQYDVTRSEVLKALEKWLGKPIFEVGTSGRYPRQIAFHIDLTMAVAWDHVKKKEVVLLESPRRAIEVLLAGRDPETLPQDPEGFLEALIKGNDDKTRPIPSKLKERLLKTLTFDMTNEQRNLDGIALELRTAGYEVIEVPGLAPGVTREGWRPPWLEGERSIFSHINTIFSGNHAIAPEVGVPQLDNYNYALFKGMGYEVIPMTSAQNSYRLLGGPRCLSESFRHANLLLDKLVNFKQR